MHVSNKLKTFIFSIFEAESRSNAAEAISTEREVTLANKDKHNDGKLKLKILLFSIMHGRIISK